MKNLIYLFVLLCLTSSCQEENQNNKACIPYFEYDKLEYYQIKIDTDTIIKLKSKEHSTKDETTLLTILGSDEPKKINDQLFISSLKRVGYKKYSINLKKHPAIDSIFCTRQSDVSYDVSCIPEYRDILTFKQNDKIVGIAKICFDCGLSIWIDNNGSIEVVDINGDFQRLEQILNTSQEAE